MIPADAEILAEGCHYHIFAQGQGQLTDFIGEVA